MVEWRAVEAVVGIKIKDFENSMNIVIRSMKCEKNLVGTEQSRR